MYNMCNRDGYCYVWDETKGDVSSEVFAYLQYSHFKTILHANRNIQELIIWGDGCGYQNKNAYLSNIYYCLSKETGVSIYQKPQPIFCESNGL